MVFNLICGQLYIAISLDHVPIRPILANVRNCDHRYKHFSVVMDVCLHFFIGSTTQVVT